MLAEAVDELRGVSRPRTSEVTIDLPLRAMITNEYVYRTSRRVEIYRRLAEAVEEMEVTRLAEEVRDRYGPLPRETENLFGVARLRLACMALGVREVGHDGDHAVLRLGPEGAKRVADIEREASGEGYPWVEVRYRKTLQELVLSFPAGSWATAGRDNLESLSKMLDAILSVASSGRGNLKE